jgi:hypothetical protein
MPAFMADTPTAVQCSYRALVQLPGSALVQPPPPLAAESEVVV